MAVPILFAPAVAFAVLYFVTVILVIYEIYKHNAKTGINIACLVICGFKIIGFSIRAYEAKLRQPLPISVSITGGLFLFIGTVVIIKALELFLNTSIQQLKKLGHPQHEKRYGILHRIISVLIMLWMGVGIASTGLTPFITTSATQLNNYYILKRISGYAGLALALLLLWTYVILSAKIRHVCRNHPAWTSDDSLHLFIASRLLVTTAFILSVSNAYSASAAQFPITSTSVWLTDQVAYPMSYATQYVSFLLIIRSSPKFEHIVKSQVYDRVKHHLSYNPDNFDPVKVELRRQALYKHNNVDDSDTEMPDKEINDNNQNHCIDINTTTSE